MGFALKRTDCEKIGWDRAVTKGDTERRCAS